MPVACGAAAHPMLHPALRFLFFRQHENVQQVPAMLLTVTTMLPVPVLFLGVSLRDRAAPAEPVARSRPFGRASLTPPPASRAARPLPGGSLLSPPFAWPPPRCAAPATRFIRTRHRLARASPRRRSRSRTPSCSRRAAVRPLNRRGGCPPVPFPEPFSPTFGTLNWVFSTPFGGLALTPDASLMPFPPASVVALPDGNSRNVSDLRPERFPALTRLPGKNAAAAASCTTPQPGGPDKEPPL